MDLNTALFLLTTLARSLWRSLCAALCGPARLPRRPLTVAAPLSPCAQLAALRAALPPAAPAPHDLLLAPFLGTFHAVLQLLAHPAFPYPLLGALHVRSCLAASAALPALFAPGAQPSVPGSVTWDAARGTRAVARGVEVDFVVEVGGGAWRARHTFLFLGARLAPQDAAAIAEAGEAAAPPVPPPAPPLGATLPLPLPATLGRAWGALSRDYNPIHVSPTAAALLGLRGGEGGSGGTVAHGMAVLLLALRAAAQEWARTGAAPMLLAGELRVRFLRPLFIPDPGCSVALGGSVGGSSSSSVSGTLHTSLSILSRGKLCYAAEVLY
jgi:hypothetical protein